MDSDINTLSKFLFLSPLGDFVVTSHLKDILVVTCREGGDWQVFEEGELPPFVYCQPWAVELFLICLAFNWSENGHISEGCGTFVPCLLKISIEPAICFCSHGTLWQVFGNWATSWQVIANMGTLWQCRGKWYWRYLVAMCKVLLPSSSVAPASAPASISNIT